MTDFVKWRVLVSPGYFAMGSCEGLTQLGNGEASKAEVQPVMSENQTIPPRPLADQFKFKRAFREYHNCPDGDEKRQKLFDFAEEDLKLFQAKYAISTLSITSRLYLSAHLKAWLAFPEKQLPVSSPGLQHRLITLAYGFTSLDYGRQLRGFSHHSACLFETPTTLSFNVNVLNPATDFNFICAPNWQCCRFDPEKKINLYEPRVHLGFLARLTSANCTPVLWSCIEKERQATEERTKDMATSGDSTLFDETFTITSIDNAKYDRVARLAGTSGDSQTVVTLDINSELLTVATGENLHCVLATSLSLDGTKDDKGWRDVATGEATLADMFDYVCHGKIYKFEDGEDGQTIKAYISFGGLLMALEGPYKKLTPLRVDYVYLLIKK